MSEPTPTDDTNKVDTAKAVDPNANSNTESTPIADLVAKDLGIQVPETAEHFDKKDVAAALKKETDDGKGDEDPGESDWVGYATEGVEAEEGK